MAKKRAFLVLADGTIFEGYSEGAEGEAVGELVFNTSMTGYQEILTDPSYANQIVTLTASHIGNTGCNQEDMESNKAWATGLVMRQCTDTPSNYRSENSLPSWLKKQNVVAISGVDTRAITVKLRDLGATPACITTDATKLEEALEKAKAFEGLQGKDLASVVSRKTIERWHEGRGEWASQTCPQKLHVVAYDFGVKHQMLKILHDAGCHVTLVPAKTSAEEVISLKPDGILLSNGPGDPEACDYAIHATRIFLEKSIPIFGICLGFQILSLALGAKTKKMKFGHHGGNHPVADTGAEKKVYITSQNHGFEVDESSLPDSVEVSHRSLFDGSLQGFRSKEKAAFGFQGHPEASPGPHDIETLFFEFIQAMNRAKSIV